MNAYSLVSLKNDVQCKNELAIGDIGIVIECKPHDAFDVMFFNKKRIGRLPGRNSRRQGFARNSVCAVGRLDRSI